MAKLTLNNVGSLLDSTTAQATINANNDLIEAALENTLSLDGTSPNALQNDLDANNKQIYNLPAPSSVNSPARLIDVVSNPTITIPGTGTSGHNVPYLDGNNTWSGTNAFQAVTATTLSTTGVASPNSVSTGNLTASGTVTLPAGSITTANLAAGGANTVKGNVGSGSADLTATQLTTIPNVFTSGLKGLVPASGGGTANFMRADGTWAAPPATVYNLLNTLNCAGQATVSDTTSFTNTYSNYEIVFIDVYPVTTGASPVLQIQSGGLIRSSGYLNGTYHANPGNSGAFPSVATTDRIAIPYDTATNTTYNPINATPGISGKLFLTDPSANKKTAFIGKLSWRSGNGSIHTANVDGYWDTAGVITGFQFSFGSGNISNGTIKIYGIT